MSKRWGWAGRGLLCILLWPAISQAKLRVRTDTAQQPDGYYIVRENVVRGILGQPMQIPAKVSERGFYYPWGAPANPDPSARYYVFAVCRRRIALQEKFIAGNQEWVTIRCP